MARKGRSKVCPQFLDDVRHPELGSNPGGQDVARIDVQDDGCSTPIDADAPPRGFGFEPLPKTGQRRLVPASDDLLEHAVEPSIERIIKKAQMKNTKAKGKLGHAH